jgi:TetR/AcrR family transcriptional regulator, cholesterol catabolism regulator
MLAGSLYHHFDSKEAIVDEILSRSLDDLLEDYRAVRDEHADPVAAIEALVRASFRAIDRYPHACAIFLKDREYLGTNARFDYLDKAAGEAHRLWIDVISDGADRNAFRNDIPPEILYRFIAYPIWLAAGWQAGSGRGIDELADIHVRLVADALAVR